MKIASLTFAGQSTLPISVQDQIANSLIAGPYDDNKEGVANLLHRVQGAWQHHGYFKAKIEIGGIQVLGENAEARTVAITAKVDAGPQYRLDEIQFRVSPAPPAGAIRAAQFTDRELREFVHMKHGDIFDPGAIQAGVTHLREAYSARGFINVGMVPAFNFDDANANITLVVDIDEGQQFHFGSIDVPGVDPEIARNLLVRSGVATGNVFDRSRFAELWKQSEIVLPKNLELEEIQRHINADSATVDLMLRIHACPVH